MEIKLFVNFEMKKPKTINGFIKIIYLLNRSIFRVNYFLHRH